MNYNYIKKWNLVYFANISSGINSNNYFIYFDYPNCKLICRKQSWKDANMVIAVVQTWESPRVTNNEKIMFLLFIFSSWWHVAIYYTRQDLSVQTDSRTGSWIDCLMDLQSVYACLMNVWWRIKGKQQLWLITGEWMNSTGKCFVHVVSSFVH